jgi:hypothetical protein
MLLLKFERSRATDSAKLKRRPDVRVSGLHSPALSEAHDVFAGVGLASARAAAQIRADERRSAP